VDREIATLYEAFCAGRPAPLADLPMQYADFARWQRQWLQGAGDHAESPLQVQLAYWRSQLDGLATLDLPTDHARPPVETFRGAEQGLILPQRLGQALKALSQREGVTLFMTLLTAFQALLARYTGQDDIVVGSPVSQRSRAATEGLIGPFINMLVLRGDLSGDPSFRQALGRVREVTLGAYAHQDVPFEHLVRALQPVRDLSRQPLFQVMFMLQNIPAAVVQCPGLTFSPLKVASGTALMDLTLIVVETPAGISATLNYNTDLFERAMIARMLAHLQSLLDSATADPDRRIGGLSLMSAAERQQLLVEWNDTRPGVRSNTFFSELFVAQVARTPDAIAVVFDGPTKIQRSAFSVQRSAFSVQHLSYAALEARANQLARYLRGLGVGPEAPVGICMERSPELLVGLLGVLKAGAAYLPLDPTYPTERIAFMLEDSRTPVLLTATTDDRRSTTGD
jgi:non-ribosomal peptide synthetase component F